jgi:hypothetical protein
MSEEGDILYRVNDRDEIVYVSESWDQFATANSGERVISAAVLNRPLWNFVTDTTTRALYRDVLKRIRDGRIIRFSFRCDSPAHCRRLEMIVARGEGDTVDFKTRTLAVEERLPQALLDPNAARTDELLRVCSWCNKVFVNGAWN